MGAIDGGPAGLRVLSGRRPAARMTDARWCTRPRELGPVAGWGPGRPPTVHSVYGGRICTILPQAYAAEVRIARRVLSSASALRFSPLGRAPVAATLSHEASTLLSADGADGAGVSAVVWRAELGANEMWAEAGEPAPSADGGGEHVCAAQAASTCGATWERPRARRGAAKGEGERTKLAVPICLVNGASSLTLPAAALAPPAAPTIVRPASAVGFHALSADVAGLGRESGRERPVIGRGGAASSSDLFRSFGSALGSFGPNSPSGRSSAFGSALGSANNSPARRSLRSSTSLGSLVSLASSAVSSEVSSRRSISGGEMQFTAERAIGGRDRVIGVCEAVRAPVVASE